MANATTVEIPEDILESARMTRGELKTEIAVLLYSQGRLSFGKARELAQMSHWEFRQLLGSRHLSPHYGEEELDRDMSVAGQIQSP